MLDHVNDPTKCKICIILLSCGHLNHFEKKYVDNM